MLMTEEQKQAVIRQGLINGPAMWNQKSSSLTASEVVHGKNLSEGQRVKTRLDTLAKVSHATADQLEEVFGPILRPEAESSPEIGTQSAQGYFGELDNLIDKAHAALSRIQSAISRSQL